ncbi:uncharacterized protein BcabD6B2_42240 [Babesia caballi]|uniref:Variant erythrocyte surface antigen-1, alpha subunit n=1 Tax=Babesia caballi TaxID=5871 RepID=A0AAV4LYE7_BABCB|nr:hypothetical protein, conserved [Babesia caballi]
MDATHFKGPPMNSHLNTSPIITGAGILPANVAKHQVCNAVLNFVIRFLEGLCEIKASGHGEVLKVIGTLRKCVGTGEVPQGFQQLVEEIRKKVEQGFDKKIKQRGNDGKLNNVFQALKDIIEKSFKTEHSTHNVQNETQNVTSYIDAVKVEEDGNGTFTSLNDKLKTLFGRDIIKPSSSTLSDNEALTIESLTGDIQGVSNAARALNSEIHSINTIKRHLLPNAAVFSAVRDAATAFIAEIKEPTKYTSHYDKHKNPEADWGRVNGNPTALQMCAKIFLGCLPLYYQALTYIYWGCHEKGGGWGNQTLANGAMRSYFDSQGLLPTFVESSRTGAHIADSALNKFSEFATAASPPLSSSAFTYASFAAELQKKVGENVGHLPTECPLSALYHGASCYFRCQQITTTKSAGGTPKTIREMLYFIAALQFSPQYDAFDKYVTEYFKGIVPNPTNDTPDDRKDHELKLQVADSGITSKPRSSSSTDTLSAADLKSYLTSTFHLAPAFIGLIQEPSKSGEPWLHSLYSNSQFNLSIPSSGAGIFGALSNYAYALQFQLSFLYIQCRNTYTVGCGWQECRFGKDVNSGSNNSAPSHICNGYTCKDPSKCEHKGSGPNSISCTHNKGGVGANCGKSGNLSPLQAFLTDCLPGFSRAQPSDPSSHLATCSGYMCHVPMGFNPNDLRAESNANTQGSHISLALGSFCGGFNTPLRQLSEKLGCLTKRTPRTLGDMFGFTWHLNGQLFKQGNQGNIDGAQWFTDLKDKLPFSYQLTSESGQKLKTFVGTGHSGHSTADLSSLYSSGCKEKGNNCGPYLYPLTHSDGATFGKPAPYASTYLSWVLYLTDELETGFQELLDTFNGHVCKGCKHNCSNGHSGSTCQCPSVVDCADVLPLLYRHGFRFLSAFRLKGMKNEGIGKGYSQTAETKRQCSAFATQLQSVINGEPLTKLLESIDEFLYLFRHYFLSNLSTFWTIYTCLILYTFFFLLDTLHLRSHLKLTSSHTVPPLALLTSAKPLPIAKLTYIGQ